MTSLFRDKAKGEYLACPKQDILEKVIILKNKGVFGYETKFIDNEC